MEGGDDKDSDEMNYIQMLIAKQNQGKPKKLLHRLKNPWELELERRRKEEEERKRREEEERKKKEEEERKRKEEEERKRKEEEERKRKEEEERKRKEEEERKKKEEEEKKKLEEEENKSQSKHSEDLSSKYSKTEPNFYKPKSKKKKKKTFHEKIEIYAKKSCRILQKNVDNRRYPGFSNFISESTLQNSSYIWSFPKKSRFNKKDYTLYNDKIYNLPSLKMSRTTTLGFGPRKDFRPVPGKDDPPPGTYNYRTFTEINRDNNKGPILASRHKYELTQNYPGPGTYNIFKKYNFSNTKIPIILKSRQGFFYDDDLKKKKFTVSCQKYYPKMNFVQKERFKDIAFGFGERPPLYVKNNTPGPGSYNVPGNFDRGLKGKLPLN